MRDFCPKQRLWRCLGTSELARRAGDDGLSDDFMSYISTNTDCYSRGLCVELAYYYKEYGFEGKINDSESGAELEGTCLDL